MLTKVVVTYYEKGFILQDVQGCVNRGILPANLAGNTGRPVNTNNAYIKKE